MIMGAVRLLWAVLMVCALAACARAAQTVEVGTRAELMAALRVAAAGDTILLGAGDYGVLKIRDHRYADFVTLRARTPGAARLERLVIDGVRFLRLEGLHIDHPSNGRPQSRIVEITGESRDIEILNSEINGRPDTDFNGHFGIRAAQTVGLRLIGNRVHDVKFGIALFGVTQAQVSDNELEDIGEDVFKFAGVTQVLVENNIGPARMFPAKGAHDDFMQFQGAPSRGVVVRGNVFVPQNSTHAQGIFFGGKGGHEDLLIEENIVVTSLARGISVNLGTDIVVRRNTVVGVSGEKGARIVVPEGAVLEHNIWTSRKGRQGGSNIIAQSTDPAAPYHYSTLFENALRRPAPRLQDLRPVPGSLAEGRGAVARLRALLAQSGGL